MTSSSSGRDSTDTCGLWILNAAICLKDQRARHVPFYYTGVFVISQKALAAILPPLLSPLATTPYSILATQKVSFFLGVPSYAATSSTPVPVQPSQLGMARKCSSCGNNGHNSRTCSGHRGHGSSISTSSNSSASTSCGGLRLFGVQLQVASPPLKKCLSMECLSPAAYYGAAAASSLSPSVSSSSSSLVSIEESAERVSSGYTSDGLMGRIQERKKGETGTN